MPVANRRVDPSVSRHVPIFARQSCAAERLARRGISWGIGARLLGRWILNPPAVLYRKKDGVALDVQTIDEIPVQAMTYRERGAPAAPTSATAAA